MEENKEAEGRACRHKHKKWPEKLQRYAPTKGNQEKKSEKKSLKRERKSERNEKK